MARRTSGNIGRPTTRPIATPTQHAQDWQEQHVRAGGSVRRITLYAAATRALRELARPRKASALIDKLLIAEWLRVNPGKTVVDLLPARRRRSP
jgi:hypothetical protein